MSCELILEVVVLLVRGWVRRKFLDATMNKNDWNEHPGTNGRLMKCERRDSILDREVIAIESSDAGSWVPQKTLERGKNYVSLPKTT